MLVHLPFELYRDLRIGDTGVDVTALQRSLDELGYGPGDSDGLFGTATANSVRRLYEHLGYTPPQDPESDPRAVQANLADDPRRLRDRASNGGAADSDRRTRTRSSASPSVPACRPMPQPQTVRDADDASPPPRATLTATRQAGTRR